MNLQIENIQGDLAGVLFLHRQEDRVSLTVTRQPLRIELVAIAKGWTNTLLSVPPRKPTSQRNHNSERIATKVAADDGLQIEASSSTSIDGDRPKLPQNCKESSSGEKEREDRYAEIIQHTDTNRGSNTVTPGGPFEVDDVDDVDDDDEMPEYWKENKDDCYFVLWIKWVNGVAYRQGSGRVLASAWEKYKEEDPVELVLG